MWVKEQGHEADHTPHRMLKLRMNGALPPLPHVSSLRAHEHLIQKCMEQKLYITVRLGENCFVMYHLIVRVSFQESWMLRS